MILTVFKFASKSDCEVVACTNTNTKQLDAPSFGVNTAYTTQWLEEGIVSRFGQSLDMFLATSSALHE
jgi:hypothetical protein